MQNNVDNRNKVIEMHTLIDFNFYLKLDTLFVYQSSSLSFTRELIILFINILCIDVLWFGPSLFINILCSD